MRKIPNEALNRPTPEAYSGMAKIPVAVVLENIRSAHNIGSFFRTCDAFAVQEVVLCGISATPPSREIHKTALGAEHTVAWRYFSTTLQAIETLQAEGYRIVAVEQAEGAVALDAFRAEPGVRYALLFGNEVFGVSQDAMDRCEFAIEIPQAGTKHSLNVAVAGGAVLWHLFAQWTVKKTAF